MAGESRRARILAGLAAPFRGPGRGLFTAGFIIVMVFVVMAIFAPWIAPYGPTERSVPLKLAAEPQPPSWGHPMGTFQLGYDVFSRIVWGSRVVLYVVALSAILSMIIGVPLGLVSGYYGGALDRALSMVMDSIYAFPGIVLAIAVASVLGPSPSNAAISLSVVYVPTFYRMVRGQTLEIRESLYVEAARALGFPDRVTLLGHILPNVAPTTLVVFGLAATDAILTEAGLAFFGLTVSYPQPDWGLDLRMAMKDILNGVWWTTFFPGLAITLLALGFALMGEGFSERYAIRTER
ncbi:MAG: ABC transporter permease [Desulfurococcales archaeon]|nr:ABC transporter permease [Desulfurococcales archaeon]